MIIRALSAALAVLLAVSAFQGFQLSRAHGEIKNLRGALAVAEQARDTNKQAVEQCTVARTKDQEQAAQDTLKLLGEHKDEINRARQSSAAIAEITHAKCLDKTTGGVPRGLVDARSLRNAAGQRDSP